MKLISVLWLSNKILSQHDTGATGTWLDATAQGLLASGQVELGNITLGDVARFTQQDAGRLHQWILPVRLIQNHNGLPPESAVNDIVRAVEEFAPEVVQVWGTENFWGLLTARQQIKHPALLEMQGLRGAIARVFNGGLTWREQLACIGLKEIIRRSTIFQSRRRFRQWEPVENEILRGHRFITAQSLWLESQIRAVNATCQIFRNDFSLRAPFHAAAPWQPTKSPRLFCSAAYPSPFKGVHVAIRALAIVKAHYPAVQLRIAGAFQRPGLRQEGYVAWLNREAKRLGVENNLCWLGSIGANEIAQELQQCAAVLLPTFIEGYCLALAEAMLVGAPSVVSFVGGASVLAENEETALFFPAGDVAMCAYQIERILNEPALAERLSRQAREIALVRNDQARIIRRQTEIYELVSAASTSSDRGVP